MTLRALLLAGAILAVTLRTASAQETTTEFWPELNVYVRLNPEARLYFIATPSREIENGQRGELVDWQIGPFIEFGLRPLIPARAAQSRRDGSRMKYLRLRSGIEYQGLPGVQTEWRIVEELTPLQRLPGEVLLKWRNRAELRWLDGVFAWRYRSRFWFEREFPAGGSVMLVPYASAEPFFDSRYDRFVRLRCQFGTAVALTPWFVPEVNYTYQTDDSGGPVLTTHALNIVAGFFF